MMGREKRFSDLQNTPDALNRFGRLRFLLMS